MGYGSSVGIVRLHVVAALLSMLLVSEVLCDVADVVHVRRRSEGPIQVLCAGVGCPVRS